MTLREVRDATCNIAELRERLSETLARRDAAIRKAFAAGYPIGALAEAANLTGARVSVILGNPHHRVGRPSSEAGRKRTT